jgi:hypothetical protein
VTLSHVSLMYSLLIHLFGFVSFYTQLLLMLFIYWSSPSLSRFSQTTHHLINYQKFQKIICLAGSLASRVTEYFHGHGHGRGVFILATSYNRATVTVMVTEAISPFMMFSSSSFPAMHFSSASLFCSAALSRARLFKGSSSLHTMRLSSTMLLSSSTHP